MPTSKRPGTRRNKKRRTSVSIGGTSQSAFAGYAPGRTNPKQGSDDPTARPAGEDQDKGESDKA